MHNFLVKIQLFKFVFFLPMKYQRLSRVIIVKFKLKLHRFLRDGGIFLQNLIATSIVSLKR